MRAYIVKEKFSRAATSDDKVEGGFVRFQIGDKLTLSDADAAPLVAAGRIVLEEDEVVEEKPRKVRYGKPVVPESDASGETAGLQIPAGNAAVAAAVSGGATAAAKPRIPAKPKTDEA